MFDGYVSHNQRLKCGSSLVGSKRLILTGYQHHGSIRHGSWNWRFIYCEDILNEFAFRFGHMGFHRWLVVSNIFFSISYMGCHPSH